MSSFALLRVSARTDLPDIAVVGIIFFKARRQFRHNANSTAHRGGNAPARSGDEGESREPAAALKGEAFSLPRCV